MMTNNNFNFGRPPPCRDEFATQVELVPRARLDGCVVGIVGTVMYSVP